MPAHRGRHATLRWDTGDLAGSEIARRWDPTRSGRELARGGPVRQRRGSKPPWSWGPGEAGEQARDRVVEMMK